MKVPADLMTLIAIARAQTQCGKGRCLCPELP